jgi:hypothetical protein
MKSYVMSGVALGALTLTCAVLLAVGLSGPRAATERYPSSTPISGLSLRVNPVLGSLSWGRTYHTQDTVTTVWRYYARTFRVGPDTGIGRDGPCVTLEKAQLYAKVRQEVSVALCPAQRGIRISVWQSVYLLP